MNNSKVIIMVLAATVMISGCTDGGGDESHEGDAISVERFELVPQTIYSGSNVTATLNVRNVGDTDANITVGDQGTKVLTSYTPDLLKISDFDAESTSTRETRENYTLSPEDSLSMNWDLHQFDESRIRFYADQTIDMAFRIPFQYKVEAYHQFQVKSGSDVESLEELGAASSNGPMDVSIQLIGSSSEQGSPVFLEEDDMQVRVEFSNNDQEEGDGVGLLNIEPPRIWVPRDNVEVNNCNTPSNIQVRGQSSTSITCNIDFTEDIDSSIREEVRVESDYNFTKTVSKDHITVEYRG